MSIPALDTLDFKGEGIRAMDFSVSRPVADICFAGFDISEAQIEPLLMSSSPLEKRGLPAARVETKKRGMIKLPWKKTPALYQVTPLVTVALATTALIFPRIARAGEPRGVAQTPIYHFDRPQQDGANAPTDDTVTAQQIRALDELLALPTGAERDVQIDDWT